jgi:nicotinate-nucleotide pyrophosphorylase (carboxylating)
MTSSLIAPDAFISPLAIGDAVRNALAEDLGRAGDVTSIATVPEGTLGLAVVVARKAGTIAGLPLVETAFKTIDPSIKIEGHARDGVTVVAKAPLMTVAGEARTILAAERVALNFIGHLSGIASATAEFVRRIAHTRARVCCTRKTTPGLRALEKYAVRCGGGFNHRFGLDDAILIKDTPIAVAGGVRAVLERARQSGTLVKIEIEVDRLDQFAGRHRLADVLLDNMDPVGCASAVGLRRALVWKPPAASRSRARRGRETGVDYLSSGAITPLRRASTWGSILKM